MTVSRILTLPLVLALAACGGTTDDDTSGPPTTFEDCGKSQCEVALSAFTKDSSAVPYCPPTADQALTRCGTGMLRTGTCGGHAVAEYTYGMATDVWRCLYDSTTGELVGASGERSGHAVQVAGEQPPPDCNPSQLPCAGS